MTSPAGTSTDFTRAVTPCLPALTRYATRLVGPADRDDLVQQALMRAWRRWSSYDARRGEPLPWLLAILADQARRAWRRRIPVLDAVETSTELHPADVDLERAITRLSKRQRQAVDLYYFVDLDVETTARAMGCSPGTVRATLHQARAALRDLLEVGDD